MQAKSVVSKCQQHVNEMSVSCDRVLDLTLCLSLSLPPGWDHETLDNFTLETLWGPTNE